MWWSECSSASQATSLEESTLPPGVGVGVGSTSLEDVRPAGTCTDRRHQS